MAGPIEESPPENHAEISQHLLRQAQAELANGEILSASKTAWAATAHAVKSACQRLGWHHHTHTHLRNAASYIATELGRDDIHFAFGYLDSMHLNWHQPRKEADTVRNEVTQAAYFITQLAALPIDKLRHNPVQAKLPRIERDGQERRLRTLTRKTPPPANVNDDYHGN